MERFPSLSQGLKRNFSYGQDGHTPDKRMRANFDSPEYDVQAAPHQPSYDTLKLETELMAAKTQIMELKASVEIEKSLRKAMQVQFEIEKTFVLAQHMRDLNSSEYKKAQLDNQLQIIQELKEDISEADRNHKSAEECWENEKFALNQQVAELKEKLLRAEVFKVQLSELKKNEIQQTVGPSTIEEKVRRLVKIETLRSQVMGIKLQQLYRQMETEQDSDIC